MILMSKSNLLFFGKYLTEPILISVVFKYSVWRTPILLLPDHDTPSFFNQSEDMVISFSFSIAKHRVSLLAGTSIGCSFPAHLLLANTLTR